MVLHTINQLLLFFQIWPPFTFRSTSKLLNSDIIDIFALQFKINFLEI